MLRILERVLAPDDGDLSPEIAHCVLNLHFSDQDKAEYSQLAERHNNGELSADEIKKLEGFVDANTVLMLLKTKARRSLAHHQPAA